MLKILLSTSEPVTAGSELHPAAVADINAFEEYMQKSSGGTRLTSAEKLIIADYIYYKWSQNRG